MRYYSFTNFYLSSIQIGIQSAHCIADTFIKYADESRQRAVLLDWAANHKTMICLNGGHASGIREAYAQLERFGEALQLPFCNFYEDEESLDSTMTCCGIVVPEYLYEAAQTIREARGATIVELVAAGVMLNADEYDFVTFLNQFGLAK